MKRNNGSVGGNAINVTPGKMVLAGVIIVGMVFRLLLAVLPVGNFDMQNFFIDAVIFMDGKWNIYKYQPSYNYSPALFVMLGVIGHIQRMIKVIPFHTLVRLTVSAFDIATLLLLTGFAVRLRKPVVRTATLFFLNPVTIILSGFHAHVDSIALFLVLAGIWMVDPDVRFIRRLIGYGLITCGLIMKHVVLFPVLAVTMSLSGMRRIRGLTVFAAMVVLFLMTFIPFWPEARTEITEHVFKFQGLATLSGITYMLYAWCKECTWLGQYSYTTYRTVFMAMAFLFTVMVPKRDILRSMNLVILFFLTFTSAHAAQYFVLPVAVGSLFPTKWFVLYSAVTSMFLIGNEAELNVHAFKFVSYNTVWIFASLWFVAECINVIPAVQRVYLSVRNRMLS